LDAVFLAIHGKRHDLWRAVAHDGPVRDILVQRRPGHARGENMLPQALEGLEGCAAGPHHGYTLQRWRSHTGDLAKRRPSPRYPTSHPKANYRRIAVLAFDAAAAVVFQRLRRARLRIVTMDMKIAAIVLSRETTLPLRNLTNFRQVPGLWGEDWTVGR
jgi:hypothetical protein